MIITEIQLTNLKGAFNTLLDLAESCQLQEYQREEYYFIGSGIESIITEIEQQENMEKTIIIEQREDKKDIGSELKAEIYKIVDSISDKQILRKAYTFIKYLK